MKNDISVSDEDKDDNDEDDDDDGAMGKDAVVTRSKPVRRTSGSGIYGVAPGVDFVRGRATYVEWKNVLYLAKLLKTKTITSKTKKGKEKVGTAPGENIRYLVHFDGFRKSSDAWVPKEKVYEINPQTRKIFNAQRR